LHIKKPSALPSIAGTSLPDGDYGIVILNKVSDLDPKDMTAIEKNAFSTQLQHALGMLDYELYVAAQLEHADIEDYADQNKNHRSENTDEIEE